MITSSRSRSTTSNTSNFDFIIKKLYQKLNKFSITMAMQKNLWTHFLQIQAKN
jgi:hypothetical protein